MDQGVSPILGVIILVAIAIVGSLVVLFIAEGLGDEVEDGPTMTMVANEQDGTLQVAHIYNGPIDWADLSISGCIPPATTGPVIPGQLLTSCTGPVAIAHVPTETPLFVGSFP